MRYLVIWEDGSILKANHITEDEDNAFLSGLIDIVDMENMTVFCNDLSWKPIEEWKF